MSDPLFEVANHSWEHRNLRILSGSKLDDEIRGAQAAYELTRTQLVKRQCVSRDGRAVQSAAPSRLSLFRFPFGACNPEALEAVGANGLYAIQWDVSSGDPDHHVAARGMTDLVVRRVRPGSIVVFHANGRGWNTAEALPMVVSALAAKGFKFATVSELLTYPGAKWEVSEKCYDSRPNDTDGYDFLARVLEGRSERFYSRYAPQGERPQRARSVPTHGFDTQVIPASPR
jgi:peptidoglycan/xylan/chitin deacetylase (PgdA/CDA1 family)